MVGYRRHGVLTTNTTRNLMSLSLCYINIPLTTLGQFANVTPRLEDDGIAFSQFNLTSPGSDPVVIRITPDDPSRVDVFLKRDSIPTTTDYDCMVSMTSYLVESCRNGCLRFLATTLVESCRNGCFKISSDHHRLRLVCKISHDDYTDCWFK